MDDNSGGGSNNPTTPKLDAQSEIIINTGSVNFPTTYANFVYDFPANFLISKSSISLEDVDFTFILTTKASGLSSAIIPTSAQFLFKNHEIAREDSSRDRGFSVYKRTTTGLR